MKTLFIKFYTVAYCHGTNDTPSNSRFAPFAPPSLLIYNLPPLPPFKNSLKNFS